MTEPEIRPGPGADDDLFDPAEAPEAPEAPEADEADEAAAEDGTDAPGEAGGDVAEHGEEPAFGGADGVRAVETERDEYLDALRRVQADFENFRKRVRKQQEDAADHAVRVVVDSLLPVLDACDGARAHDSPAVGPIADALMATLEKQGLVRVDPLGSDFDPNIHEAVIHEPADDDSDATTVTEVLRVGYVWNERVLRPAMVKVKG